MPIPLKKCLFLIIVWALQLILVNPANAAKLFLVGGALQEDNASFFTGLSKATGKYWKFNIKKSVNCSLDWEKTTCPRIAVATSGSENLATGIDVFTNNDTVNFKGLSYFNLFQKWGFSPKHVRIAIDNYTSASVSGNPVGDANIALIQQADIVFFNGGDQSYHSRSWINNDGTDSPILKILRERVKAGSVIISGSSAGMAVQGQTIYGEGDSLGYLTINDLAPKSVDSPTGMLDDRLGNSGFQYEHNGGKLIGFGFLTRPIAFDTHFEARTRLGRMIVAMKSINATIGIGADENTAIFINDDEAKIFGQRRVFIVDSSEANFKKTPGPMNVLDLHLSLLTEGDTYNLKTNQVISSKPLISTVKYQGSLDDFNIFKSYSSTFLINRLINQTGTSNNGFDDKLAPKFHYVFRKDEKTLGYCSQNAFTADHVIFDILSL